MKRSALVLPLPWRYCIATCGWLALVGCSTPGPAPSPGAPKVETGIARAKQLMRSGNYDEALLVTDSLLAGNPGDHAARLVAADANLALAATGKGNVQALLLDALHNLEAAAASRPDDPATRLRLADVYLKTSAFEKGRDSALAAAHLLRDRQADDAAVSAAVLVAADNEMQMFVDARQPEIARQEPPSERTQMLAKAVLARLQAAKQGLAGKAAVRAARVYQWLAQDDSALAELERGIQADPSEPEVHVAYQDFMLSAGKRAECVAAYKRFVADSGDDPTILFYLGRAEFSAADGLRNRGQWAEADADYEQAKATFARYQTLRPAHKATATHWQAMCDLSRARMALDRGAPDDAKRLYDTAYTTDPRVLETGADGRPTIVDSFGGTYAGGLFLLGTSLAEGSSADSLRRALAFFEEVIGKHGDAVGQFYNNAGLAARDLGASVAKQDPAQAAALWERSYGYYKKAVELVPDDPRIVNDCGLMLVYHLHRDLDQAKAMFERAIELGEAQLAALPDDAGEDQRNFLEEAVGDAYQNLGVMARQQGRPFADYQATLERAVRFYPYQRRTAAQLLRSRGERAEGLPGANAAPAPRPQASAESQAFAEVRAAVEKAAAANDYDAGLLALDARAADLAGHAPFQTLFGRLSLLYGLQARGDGGSASQIDGLFADAVAHLGKARDLDPEASDTRYWLTRALLESGQYRQSADEAASLLSHLRSLGGDAGLDLLSVHRARAEAAARAYIAGKQAGGDDQDLLRGARESLRYLADHDGLDASTVKTWIGLEQWAGAPAQALEVAVRAAAAASPATEVLDQAVTLASQLGQSERLVAALEGSADPTKRWYLGRALFQRAQEQWAGDPAAALASLEASRAAFAAARAGNPAYADSCDQWIALGLGSKGVMLLGAGQTEAAEAALLESLRLRPDCAANDLGGGNSTKRGLLVLGGKYQDDLVKLEALMRAAGTAAPDDVDFANNHGLAARDLGTQLERSGDKDAASAMYEAGFASYQRAAARDLRNVRLRNDCALMLIYHLHRDLEQALATLESARDDGLRRLRDEPPTTAQERQDLEEAVGDCIENIGYYHEHHTKDAAKAIAAYEQCLQFHPKDRRAAAGRLRALRGNDR